jgi:hypothetical protein
LWDAGLLQHALQKSKNYTKSYIQIDLAKYIGKGLLTVEEAKAKKLNQLFTRPT